MLLSALRAHIFLLLSFRHPFTGLPRQSVSLIMWIVLASAALYWFRAGSLIFFIMYLGLIATMVRVHGSSVACAFALFSVGVSLISIPLQVVLGQLWPAQILETFGLLWILNKAGRKG